MKSKTAVFAIMAAAAMSLVLTSGASAMTVYGEENAERIEILPVYQGAEKQNKYVIEDKNAVNYIIWLFSNMEAYADAEGWVSDAGYTEYSFTNAAGEVLCEFISDGLCNVCYSIPKSQSEQVYCLDFDELGYAGKKILAIRDGKAAVDDNIMSDPSCWSKELMQLAADRHLIPKLNQIGYQAAITRLDVCEIAESFLFDCMSEDDVVSYYRNFYYVVEAGDTYGARKREEELQSEMTAEDRERYFKMRQLKKENLFGDCNRRSAVLLKALGIIDGKEDNSFCPDDFVTREEMAKILSNLWHYINPDSVIEAQESDYKDSDKISDWAKEYVNEMTALGIFKGNDDAEFEPQRNMTKEEVIVTLLRLFEIAG